MSSSSHPSHWRRSARRLVRDPVAMISLAFIVLVCLMGIFAPLITKHDPNFQDLLSRYSGLSREHWLGTDDLGRDYFSRLAYGARVSMLTTFLVAFFAVIIAVPVGLFAGYRSGGADTIAMRLTDALMSIPPLVLALAIAAVLGPGTRNAIIALVVVVIPGLVRLVRGQALAVREEGFVEASKAIGTSSTVIINKRVFPHTLSPLIVQVSTLLGTILVVESSLSFLGLGTQLPNPSWGAMLKNGFTLMATDARLLIVPAVAIAATTLAFNAFGDGLRDALLGDTTAKRKKGDVLGTTTVVKGAAVPAALPSSDGEAGARWARRRMPRRCCRSAISASVSTAPTGSSRSSTRSTSRSARARSSASSARAAAARR